MDDSMQEQNIKDVTALLQKNSDNINENSVNIRDAMKLIEALKERLGEAEARIGQLEIIVEE